MDYLLLRMAAYLAVAALIGGAVGWLLRRWLAKHDLTNYVTRQAHEDLEVRLQHGLRSVAAERNGLKTVVAELKAERDKLAAQHEQAAAGAEALSRERDELEGRNANLRTSLEEARREAAAFPKRLEESEKSLREVTAALDAANVELASLMASAAALEADAARKDEDAVKLSGALSAAETERDGLLATVSELSARCEDLSSEVEALRRERDELSAEREVLAARAGELEGLQASLESSLASAARERDSLLRRADECERDKADRADSLGREKSILRSELERLGEERDAIAAKLQDAGLAAERLIELEAANAKLTAAIEQLSGEGESLLQRVAGFEVEKASALARFQPAPPEETRAPLRPVSVEEVSALLELAVAEQRRSWPESASDHNRKPSSRPADVRLEMTAYVSAGSDAAAAAPAQSSDPEREKIPENDLSDLVIYQLAPHSFRGPMGEPSLDVLARRLDHLQDLSVNAIAIRGDEGGVAAAARERGLAVLAGAEREVNARLDSLRLTRNGGEGLDLRWDRSFAAFVRSALSPGIDLSVRVERMVAALATPGAGEPFRRVIWTESPDEPVRVPALSDPGSPYSRDARKRSALAAVALFTTPGAPAILQGQELLAVEPYRADAWVDAGRLAGSAGVRALYRDLIRFRRSIYDGVAGLRETRCDAYHQDAEGGVVAYQRPHPGGQTVVVAMNLSGEPKRGYYIGVPEPGVWRVRFNSSSSFYSDDSSDFAAEDAASEDVEWGGMPCRIPISLDAYAALILAR